MRTTALMQKVAEVAPEKYAFLVKTAEEVKQSPFRDEIVDHLDTLIKKAMGPQQPGLGARFGNAMAGIGATVATGVAFSLAGDMVDAAKRGITKSRHYKAMLSENPDLKELPAKDVQKAFSSLHRFNPEFASDPTVAGSFVRRQATLGEFDTKMLTDMVSARKNLKDIKGLPIPGKLPWDTEHGKKPGGSPININVPPGHPPTDLGPLTSQVGDLSRQLREDRIARESAEDAVLGPRTVRGARLKPKR